MQESRTMRQINRTAVQSVSYFKQKRVTVSHAQMPSGAPKNKMPQWKTPPPEPLGKRSFPHKDDRRGLRPLFSQPLPFPLFPPLFTAVFPAPSPVPLRSNAFCELYDDTSLPARGVSFYFLPLLFTSSFALRCL